MVCVSGLTATYPRKRVSYGLAIATVAGCWLFSVAAAWHGATTVATQTGDSEQRTLKSARFLTARKCPYLRISISESPNLGTKVLSGSMPQIVTRRAPSASLRTRAGRGATGPGRAARDATGAGQGQTGVGTNNGATDARPLRPRPRRPGRARSPRASKRWEAKAAVTVPAAMTFRAGSTGPKPSSKRLASKRINALRTAHGTKNQGTVGRGA